MKNRKILIVASRGSKIPLEVTAVKNGNTAFITVKGHIYEWGDASSMAVERTIKEFKEDGITTAELYVNSPGGSCFEANEIINLLKDNFTSVTMKVGALAASAASYFLTKFPSSAKKNSQVMIHKPMMGSSGNEDQVEANLKVLKNLTLEYKQAYAAKMGKTEEAIEKLWEKGDYWMNAKEAKEAGLIDEIEDEDETIDASSRLQLVACGAPNVPKETKNKNTKTEIKRMELSVLAARLGLPSTAAQVEVDAKLTALQTAAASADGLVQAAADQEAQTKVAKVKALLDGAEKDKKITAAQRPQWQVMADANLEAATTAIGAMLAITAITDGLNPGANATQTAAQANWTYADYQEKDQEAFGKLPEAKQTALTEAYYKE